jgi:hypothetical protein
MPSVMPVESAASRASALSKVMVIVDVFDPVGRVEGDVVPGDLEFGEIAFPAHAEAYRRAVHRVRNG